MTTSTSERVIATVGQCECHAVACCTVHHHDFPDAHAEGQTSVEAATHLLYQLRTALDSVQSGFRREAIEKAIVEVNEFVEHETTTTAH
jgi:hypothetical protein